MVTYTVDKYGRPGMPTFNIKKVKRMLMDGRARIFRHRPFTVQLLYAESLATQETELCMDAGYQHIGVSVKSKKHEYAHAQYNLLSDEKQRHDDRRKYRRTRRNRKRYRKPRFDNRKKDSGWLAPSIQNKMERHVDIVKAYAKVLPVGKVVLETASFDTQLLEALEAGTKIPEGKDYQQGARYQTETMREAVFYRDGYKCLCCGKENQILRAHHIGFWKNPSDHTDRMGNLASVCIDCHTSKNHKPGGKLYGWAPKIKPLTGAAFMNTVRWQMVSMLRDAGFTVVPTYGAMTKAKRISLRMEKTHANDAYAMGEFHPKHKAREAVFTKRRRNNRILEKFYDAKYKDIRDDTVKSGSQLSCGRTKRSIPRNNPSNERAYRGEKTSKGRRSIRRTRYPIRPDDIILYKGKRIRSSGVNGCGKSITFFDGKTVPVMDLTPVVDRKTNAPVPIEPGKKVLYKGKPRTITKVSGDTVTLNWQYAVATKDVVCLFHQGGWIQIS